MNNFKKISKIAGIVFLILIFAIGIYVMDLFGSEDLQILADQTNQKLVNGLVVGYDAGADGRPRPDTIFLVSADLGGNGLGLVSLPRDTRVQIPGYSSHYKLNTSFALGGIDLLQKTVEDLLGAPIHFYVELDFFGFENIIDTLGGVTVNVQQRMEYTDEAGDLHIDIKPGVKELDGERALQFVRYRDPIRADIGRIERQQQLMEALIEQAFRLSIVPKIPGLLGDLNEYFRTDLPFRDMARLAKMLIDIPRDRIEMTILPGSPEYINGVSYWIPHPEGVEMVSLSMVNTKDYLENVRYTVELLNGCGVSGLAGERGELLEYWGFSVENLGNADSFDYEFTSISYGPGGREGALRISSLIGGIPRENDQLEADEIIIILGQDQKSLEKGGTL